jgi:protein-disulfide isomerase
MNRSEVRHLTLPVGERDHAQGTADAAATLVEYGDYECPFCAQAYPILKNVLKHFGTRLRFVYRNFPLSEIHPRATPAALAAETAALHGKFWEMHDLLFDHQDRMSDADLAQYAARLGIGAEAFAKDVLSEEIGRRVQEDFMSGVRSGVNGTPTFFLNGARYDGSWYYAELVAAIDAAIRVAGEQLSRR